MAAARRPFRIETTASAAPQGSPQGSPQASHQASHHVSHPAAAMGLDGIEAPLARIFGELSEVRAEIARFRERDPTADRERDRNVLWAGIETIQDAIRSTKMEIASLHAEGARGERLMRATSELEAVVNDTEAATEVILSSAERIDAVMAELTPLLVGEAAELATIIQNEVIKTFEACNFQDITGQRIRKVVKLLVFIEQRVARMTDIWGGAEHVAQEAGIVPRAGDEALLNGPALADDHGVVSQDDIDSLFA